MAFDDPVTVVASAARTATGNSDLIKSEDLGETVALLADVTAVSGTTPSMTLSVEWSNDGTNWATPETADAFAAITAAAKKVKTFERKAAFNRVVWTITGTTPSFTFSVWEYVAT
jgi:hypothetical protein